MRHLADIEGSKVRPPYRMRNWKHMVTAPTDHEGERRHGEHSWHAVNGSVR
jgi:hypothetical protein